MIQILFGLRKCIDLDRPLGENFIHSSQVVCSHLRLSQHHMNHPGSPQQLLPAPNVVVIQLGSERKAQIFLQQHWCVDTQLESDSCTVKWKSCRFLFPRAGQRMCPWLVPLLNPSTGPPWPSCLAGCSDAPCSTGSQESMLFAQLLSD